MVRYFSLIPAAALRRELDGHVYAHVGHTVSAAGVRDCAPRMVRADGCRVDAGVAWVPIGAMGDAIAQRVNLPFGVTFRAELALQGAQP